MHECENFQDLFYEYIDGTISKADKAELMKHLESCEQCKKELKFTENVIQELRETPAVPLPENFNAALRKKLEHTPVSSEKKWLRYLPKYSLAISAVAAFAIMVIAYNGHFKPSELQPSDIQAGLPATSVPQVSEQELKSETADNISDAASTNEASKDALTNQTTTEQILTTQKKTYIADQSTSQPKQTAPPFPAASSAPESQTTATDSVSFGSNSNNHKASGGSSGGSGGGSSGGGSASVSVSRTEETVAPARNPQGLIFVIHSTISHQTLKQLYDLPSFETVDVNYYQIQRSHQHALIELLKDCEYSIHFASEASRVDQSAIIIELI